MHGQPNTPRPVQPVRDPPRLDAFGNPLPEDWHLVFEARRASSRSRTPDQIPLAESLDAVSARLSLLFRALVSSEALDQLIGTGPVEKIYSVPRRFDISTLFVVSMAFAFLFAILAYCGFSSVGKLACGFYISGVGFAQAALFQSRAPRLSSIIAGGVLLLLVGVVGTWGNGFLTVIPTAIFSFIFGLPAGYLVGTICGGVFLIADKLRTRWGW